MEAIDVWEVARRASFIGEALLILLVGKLARDLLAMARGYKTAEIITVKDNAAAAIDLAGFMFALAIGLVGSIIISAETWAGQAADIAEVGLLVIGCLVVNDWITDKLIFRGLDDHAELNEKGNVALAVGRAASAIATGFVIRGALGHDTSLVDCLAWVGIGQVALVLIALLYQWITPYDDLAEVRSNNIAAGLPIAGILLAVGITVEAGLHGQFHSFADDLQAVGLYLGLSVILLWLVRTLTDLFLMPGTKLAKEIATDRNAGAGAIEATSFVIGAELLAYFLN